MEDMAWASGMEMLDGYIDAVRERLTCSCLRSGNRKNACSPWTACNDCLADGMVVSEE